LPTTSEERDFAAKHLRESRERFFQTVRGLTAEQLNYKPAPDRWSVGQNLEHVVLVERRGSGFVATSLKQPADPSRRSGYPGSHEGLVAMARDRSHPRRGPEAVQPKGGQPLDQLLQGYDAARKFTRELLATDVDLHTYFAPHPVFGELDCYQWILILAAHSDRHRAQAEEVMAAPGFPRAAAAG
jgi:DinB family protein